LTEETRLDGAATMARLVAGDYADPDGGPPLSVPTRSVVIADSLAGREDDCIDGVGLAGRLAVVCDRITQAVLGDGVARALGDARCVVLEDRPHADRETVEAIRAATASADALIAVGSGTINDLCKFAAFQDGKPYVVFATAPSMNGYTSVSAAITVDGLKKSLPAAAAVGVFMDLEVLAAAPPRMIRSGLGDSLCRPTAQADWLLAHLLLDQPYREAPFAILAADEEGLFAEPEALMAGDLAAMERLARTLVLSGFGMTVCGGSYPASQGEHLISHYLDMMAPDLPESFHGEQIAVTTLTMARLQERLLAEGPPRLSASSMNEGAVTAHFGEALGHACWAEFAKKRLDEATAERLNQRLEERWDNIASRISEIMKSSAELQRILEQAGGPTRPRDLGWPDALYARAVSHARLIRHRYTALDLAGDAGLLEDFSHGLTTAA